MAAELSAGVAGAGAFGAVHARKYAAAEGVRLRRVYDPHLDRARGLAADLGAEGVDDLAAFLDGLDVVTVAAPGAAHAQLAAAALRAGAHVYVEKPLAVTLRDADDMVVAAARAGRVLACGHQERVVFRAMGLLALPERALRVESVRRGLPNARNRDVSCVLDLMIHDLDLALLLAGGEPVAVEAEGGFDAVEAEITFDTGLTAAFRCDRAAATRERTMALDLPSGAVAVDFLAPGFENRSAAPLNALFAADPQARDPVGASVAAFLAAVRGKGAPVADGRAGVRAVDLALAVEHAAGL